LGKRMTLPKDEESMKKIMEEIHGTHEHHHHHEEVDLLTFLINEINDLKKRVQVCEENNMELSREIRNIYKVLVFIMKALLSEGEERNEALEEALLALEKKL